MIDDDMPDSAPLARAFDYFKHLMTVSLIAIGGVLGLLKGEGPTLKPTVVVLVVATLALGGVISMMMLSAISSLELKGDAAQIAKARRTLVWMQSAATLAVMFGMGIFLGAFVGVLNE